MASNNAIGEGALILTTSADRMLAGLDSVQKQAGAKAKGIADSVDKGSKSKSGGFLSGLVGGLAGAGIFTALVKGPELAMRAFAELEKRATGLDKGALQGIKQTFRGIQSAGLGILQKFVTAAAPAIMVLGQTLLKLFEKLSPLISGVAEVFEVFGFVCASVIEAIVDSLGGLEGSTEGWGETTLNVLRVVGKAFAYVWDTLKAGAGVIAVVAGLVVQGFGKIVEVVGQAIKMLSDLASVLPEEIRPDWLGQAGQVVEGWGAQINEIGKGMREWGKGAVLGFGQSAAAVDAWFNGVAERMKTTKQGLEAMAGTMQLKLTGAMLGGSAEAFSTVAKFQSGSQIGGDVGKQQLGVQRAMRDDIKAIRRGLEKREPLEAI